MGDALPYFTPAAEAVQAGAWSTSQGSTDVALPEWFPAWDISHHLIAARRIEINLDQVYAATRIPTSSHLGLSVVFVSDFEHQVYASTFEQDGGSTVSEIAVDIPGQLLGPLVTLSTGLVLRDPGVRDEGPIAWRRGSVLWNDVKKVRLYGDESQFPITEVDFADWNRDPSAPWFVEIGPDLELPAMGAVQLLLNSRFPLVIAAARGDEGGRPELAVVRSQLFADIGRTLIEFALAQDDLEQDWPDDSLGAILTAAVTSRFREPISDLRLLRLQDPPAWAAKTAGAFGLLREPLR